MRLKIIFPFFVLLVTMVIIPSVMAHCPLCTAAAGTGVAVARYYGVDDSIVGVFLGAFIVSSALWLGKWMKKKSFHIEDSLLILLSFFFLVIPLYFSKIITPLEMVKEMPEHHSFLGLGVFGIDKLFFGILLGTFVIWGTFGFSDLIKKKRGSVLFPYQGISFMMIALVVLSLALWRLA